MGKGAEAVSQYLLKGKQVGIQGELRQNRWEQEGQKRSKVEIFVTNLQLLGGGRGPGRPGRAASRGSAPGGAGSGARAPRPTISTTTSPFNDS